MTELTFQLDAFEGPLDLLLHLIAKNKVSIYDIPISTILSQYLAVLDQAKVMDLNIAGDFIAMAAQLVYIKSKMLLPVYEDAPEDDPRAQLVEMLLEYQRMQQATPFLKTQGEIGRDLFTKSPEPLPNQPIEYHHHTNDLLRAAARLLERSRRQMPPSVTAFAGIVGRETVPISTKVRDILQRFLSHSRLQFSHLLRDCTSRSEIVATFLAVLELSKTRRVMLEGTAENPSLRLATQEESAP